MAVLGSYHKLKHYLLITVTLVWAFSQCTYHSETLIRLYYLSIEKSAVYIDWPYDVNVSEIVVLLVHDLKSSWPNK